MVREGVSSYSIYALEAWEKPAREKYNLLSNQLADGIFHDMGFEAQMDYGGDPGHRLQQGSVLSEAGVGETFQTFKSFCN